MAILGMFLGMVTVICMTMVGAILGVTGQLPDEPFVRVLARYVKGGRGGRALSEAEVLDGLKGYRRFLTVFTAIVVIIAAITAILGALSRSEAAWYFLALLGALSLNAFIIRAMVSVWVKRMLSWGRP